MMQVRVRLFGAFRDHEPQGSVILDLEADAPRVSDVRRGLQAYAAGHWPRLQPGLLGYSAFASDEGVLREDDPLPANGEVAVLPPVSGG